jgi:hypothetical protein
VPVPMTATSTFNCFMVLFRCFFAVNRQNDTLFHARRWQYEPIQHATQRQGLCNQNEWLSMNLTNFKSKH